MREFARSFYKSTAWKKCRESYIAKVFGLCERCGSGGKIVHHKIYLNERNINEPSVTLAHENLELLCHCCHNQEHMISKKNIIKNYFFDEYGNMHPVKFPPI
jgi:5-methylcytosine-specific restriction endonuclease McrA